MKTARASNEKCFQRSRTLILGLLLFKLFTSISLTGCNEVIKAAKIVTQHESIENSRVQIWKSTKTAQTDRKTASRVQVKQNEHKKTRSYKHAVATTLQSLPQLTTSKQNMLESLASNYHLLSQRPKRQTGSPLPSAKEPTIKSYYDFVIVEASHKFWSIFEITTIIIIIYSIFAAMYYSKLNPLVSKLDYVDYIGGEDYIGGGRRSNAFDLDFEDNAEDALETPLTTTTDHAWPSNMAHSMKFILEAISKLPNDLENKL